MFTNRGTLNLGENITDFDSFNLHGLELRGNVPLTPEIRIFLESRGNMVTQSNGRITFHGNLLHTFSQDDVAAFLAHGNPPAPKPAPHF